MRFPSLRSLIPGLALCLLVGLLPSDAAARDAELYEGEAVVAGQEEAERQTALREALGQVLVKLSGDRSAATRPGVAEALSAAPALVEQFRYRQEVDVGSGTPSYRQILVARFQRAGVDALLAEAGLPLWPAPRARPVMWLVIDDGRGPRLVGAAQAAAVTSLLQRAGARGLGIDLPEGTADEAELARRAVWQGESAAAGALADLSTGRPLLLGRLYRSGGGWVAEWSLQEEGTELRRWRSSEADAQRALADGADGSADALASRFALLIASGEAGSHEIEVAGLRSGGDLVQVLGYLQGLSVVRRVEPVATRGDSLRLRLDLMTGPQGFRRLVEGGRVLRPRPGDELAFELR